MLSILMFFISLLTKIKERAGGKTGRSNKLVDLMATKSLNKLSNLKERRSEFKSKGFLGDLLFLATLLIAILEIIPILIVAFAVFMIVVLALTLVVTVYLMFSSFFMLGSLPKVDIPTLEQDDLGGGRTTTRGVDGSVLSWTKEELAANLGVLSEKEQMYYKLGILINESLVGFGATADKPFYTGAKPYPVLDVKLLWGTSSVESTMKLNNSNTAFDIFTEYSDYLTKEKNDWSTYQLFGINHTRGISTYLNLLGKGDRRSRTEASFNEVKKAYPKPVGKYDYENQFIPYGVMVMTAHYPDYVDTAETGVKSASTTSEKDLVKERMKHWNIAYDDHLYNTIRSFLAMNQFHGAKFDEYKGYIDFWLALYSLSADSNGKMSLENYKLVGKNGGVSTEGYGESEARSLFMGKPIGTSNAKWNAIHAHAKDWKIDESRDLRIALNGEIIDKPLWTFLFEKLDGNADLNNAWNQLVSFGHSKGNIPSRFMNYYYGYISLLEANRFVDTIAPKMTLVSKGKAKVGKMLNDANPSGNARIGGKTTLELARSSKNINSTELKYIETYYVPHFGSVAQYDIPSAPQASYVDEKYGVPFYGQGLTYKEEYGTMHWTPYSHGKKDKNGRLIDTFNRSGCMIYAVSWAISAKKQTIINPPETATLLMAYKALGASGIVMQNVPSLMKDLGLTSKYLNAGYDFNIVHEAVKNGAVAVVRYNSSSDFVGGTNHFLVIYDVQQVNGKDVYSIYTSSNFNQTLTKYNRSKITHGLHSNALIIY